MVFLNVKYEIVKHIGKNIEENLLNHGLASRAKLTK